MKKKMFGFKRFLAVLTSVALMLSSVVTVMAGDDTSQTPQPVLKMTVSDNTITDSVTNRAFDVWDQEKVNTKSEKLTDGSYRNYVTITYDNNDNAGGIRFVDGEDTSRMFTQKDKTTVEMWAKVNPVAGKTPLLFMFTPEILDDNGYSGVGTDFCYYSGSDALVTAYGAKGISLDGKDEIESAYGNWTHYVFTRSYDNVADKYTVSVYVNGIKILEREPDIRDNMTIKKPTEADTQMIQVGGFWSLDADIGALNVYDQVLTDEQVSANFNSTQHTYTTDTVDTFNVTAVSPEDNSDINVNQGSIKVSFNNDIDAFSIDDAEIKLKNDDGDNVVIKKEMSADEKSLIVKFGKLTKGKKYTLTVKNLYSKYRVKSADLTYTYNATVDSVYFDSDVEFQKLNDTQIGEEAPALEGMNYIFGNVIGNGSVTVQKMADDENAPIGLRVVQKDTNSASALSVPIANAPEDGYIIIEYKVKGFGGSATGGRKLGALFGSGGAKVGYSVIDMSGESIQYQNPSNTSETKIITAGQDGFSYIRTVLSKDSTGCYVADIYDINDGGKWIASYKSDLTSIEEYKLINLWSNTANTIGADLAYAKVYSAINPEILNTEYRNDGKVNIFLNADVNSFDPKELTLTNTDTDATVNVYVSRDEENANKLVIEPQENGSRIDKNASYTIDLSSIISVDGISLHNDAILKFGDIYGISALEFKDQTGAVLTNLKSGTTKLVADFNFKSANSGIAKAILAVYNGEMLVQVGYEDVEYDVGVSVPVNVSAEGFTANDNYSAKIMIWNTVNTLMPITGAEELPIAK